MEISKKKLSLPKRKEYEIAAGPYLNPPSKGIKQKLSLGLPELHGLQIRSPIKALRALPKMNGHSKLTESSNKENP